MWLQAPSDMRGVERDRAEFQCRAGGSPQPGYTWVDWEGRDATEREGEGRDDIMKEGEGRNDTQKEGEADHEKEEEDKDIQADITHSCQAGSWTRYRAP